MCKILVRSGICAVNRHSFCTDYAALTFPSQCCALLLGQSNFFRNRCSIVFFPFFCNKRWFNCNNDIISNVLKPSLMHTRLKARCTCWMETRRLCELLGVGEGQFGRGGSGGGGGGDICNVLNPSLILQCVRLKALFMLNENNNTVWANRLGVEVWAVLGGGKGSVCVCVGGGGAAFTQNGCRVYFW